MNQHDSSPETDRIAALPRLACDQGGHVFAEPWRAQAFALAVKLSEQGHFTWKEWAAALADELKAAAARAEPDNGSHCYEHWLATLEWLETAKGLSDPAAMAARRDAWADAYRHTPYGEPVELGTAWVRDAHEHQPDLKLWKSGNYQQFLPSACEHPSIHHAEEGLFAGAIGSDQAHFLTWYNNVQTVRFFLDCQQTGVRAEQRVVHEC